jgi:ring-1,2-phenylacetyl-CoA epoxidase subunit PaaC
MTETATGPLAPETATSPRLVLLLALADDELIMGHRHAQWTGVAPHVEEDLAFSSIAQDEIGHAVVWYELAAPLAGTDPDALAFGRPPEAYRHAVLVERDTQDWAYTLARQYVYDTAEDVRLRTLARSGWEDAAAATGALLREERYHLQHARTWLARLAAGPTRSRERITAALAEVLAETPGLFETLPGEERLLADGTLALSHHDQWREWTGLVGHELGALDLRHLLDAVRETFDGGDETAHGLGGRHGRHSPDFTPAWETLTGTYRAHPGARW